MRVSLRWISCFLLLSAAACDCGGGEDLSSVRPEILANPAALEFGEVPVGERRTLTLLIDNRGEALLSISRIEIDTSTGAFALEGSEPTSVGPSGSASLTVAFLPSEPSQSFGLLSIHSNDPDEPVLHVPIRGRGILSRLSVKAPAPSCAGESLSTSAGQVPVGEYVERVATFESRGDSPVTIQSVTLETGSTEWALVAPPAPGTQIASGSELGIIARFTPADLGGEQAVLVVRTDAANRPEVRVALCGEGAEVALCARPVPLDLGSVTLGQTASGTLEISNCGGVATDLTSLTLTSSAGNSGFTLSQPTLPRTLTPGGAVEARVHYTARTFGAAQAFLSAEVSRGRGLLIPVFARGLEDCAITAFPTRVPFGTVPQGQTAEQTVLLANLGMNPCTLVSLAATSSAGFSVHQPPALPKLLGSGDTQTVRVRYQPRAAGAPEVGVLIAETGAGPVRVDLLGNTTAMGACDLEPSPAFVNFGLVARGQIATQSFDLRNVSDANCVISEVFLDRASDPGLGNLQFFNRQLRPGESVSVTLDYRPFRLGAATGKVIVRSNDASSPEFTVPIFGSSPMPSICVTPRFLDFGAVEQPTTRTVTLVGCGSAASVVTDLVFSTPDVEFEFPAPVTLPFELQPGDSRVVEVTYTPRDLVGDTAEIAVGSDDPSDPIVYVGVTGGPNIVPVDAGRYLYYWEIPSSGSGGDIVRMPLQGAQVPQPYWGSRTGRQCAGCHTISSDGKYLAVIGEGNFELRVIDTEFDVEVVLPFQASNANFVTFRPDPNSNPPYQFIYSDGDNLQVGSVFGGYLGELPGANDPNRGQKMATWGSNGKIAFVRGDRGGGFGFYGPTDIMLVDEGGGVPVPLVGASGNGAANYYPQFSPDAKWLVYAYSPGAQGTLSAQDGQLKVIASDQSGNILLLPNANGEVGATNSFPSFSKNGQFITFASKRAASLNRSWDIFIAPFDPVTGVDGEAFPVPVVNTPDFEHAAQWSP